MHVRGMVCVVHCLGLCGVPNVFTLTYPHTHTPVLSMRRSVDVIYDKDAFGAIGCATLCARMK